MFVNKRGSLRNELRTGNVQINQFQRLDYPGNAVKKIKTENEIKYDLKSKEIGLEKVVIQKQSKIIRHKKISLERAPTQNKKSDDFLCNM